MKAPRRSRLALEHLEPRLAPAHLEVSEPSFTPFGPSRAHTESELRQRLRVVLGHRWGRVPRRSGAGRVRRDLGRCIVPLAFTATAAGLPLGTAYANRLALTFVNRANGSHFQKAVTFAGSSAAFTVPSPSFASTVAAPTPYDYDVYLTNNAAFGYNANAPRRLSLVTDTSPHLFVIARPAWLASAVASLGGAAAVQEALGSGSVGYAFRLATAGINVPLPATSGTPFKLFDGLASGLTSGLDVWLYARLTGDPGGAVLKVGSWHLRLTLLGNTLVNKVVTPADSGLAVSGTVNARTLGGLTSLTVRTAKSLDLLALLTKAGLNPTIDRTFGDGNNGAKWAVTGVPVPLTAGLLTASFFLQGTFKAALEALAGDASLTLSVGPSGLSLNKAASWVQLGTRGSVQLAMQAGLSVAPICLSILGYPVEVFRASVVGTASMKVNVRLRVNLSGALLPAPSYAGLLVGYDLKYAAELLPDGDPDPASFKPLASSPPKQVRLFGLKLPPPD